MAHPTIPKERIVVPCGKCLHCLSNIRSSWSFRLEQEYKRCIAADFLTLTYDDNNLIYGESRPTLLKKDLQDFIKRVRKATRKEHAFQLRYYAVGEYGTKTQRPHYHIILFNIGEKALRNIEKLWNKGNIHRGDVNDATIAYTTKYLITKSTNLDMVQNEFSLMSRRPPLGDNYLKAKKFHQENSEYTVKMNSGNRIAMPRFYQDKIFTKYTKKRYKIRLQKQLDKADLEWNKYQKSLGNNPEIVKVEQINQSIRRKAKNATKSNTL